MQQLQLTIDQDSQLLNELVSAVRSPTLSRSAKLAEIGRILAHFDLPIEAPRVAGQLWSATDLGKELGVSAQAIGRLANLHNLKRPAFGEYRLDQASSSRKQVECFLYNRAGRDEITRIMRTNHHGHSSRSSSKPHPGPAHHNENA
ncbi:hypothetical protein ACW5WK_02425 [Aeromonas enteropelogenes]|uniref:hypothetical protein n=1 Tax=Aeromonas enteropelogenes TaxID=29489 RepID=UPI0005A94E05|nr:hypothetical protein [Aeromonas enteropelogenes]UBH56233.1 hypothetical protein LA341_20555 [Aeromonas enteropelogenes]